MHICANGVRQAWSEANARIEHEGRYRRACYRSRLQRRRGAGRRAASGSFRKPGGEPPSDGDRRLHRPRRRDRQGRHRGARDRLHRAAQFHRRADGQDRRSAVSHRAGHLQSDRRPTGGQSRQGPGDGGERQSAIEALPGIGEKPERTAIDCRSELGHRTVGAGRHLAGASAARTSQDQSRLYRNSLRRSAAASALPISPSAIWSVRQREFWRPSSARIRSMSRSRRAKPISSLTGSGLRIRPTKTRM